MPGGVKHKERVGDRPDLEFDFGLRVAEGGKIVFSKKDLCRPAQLDKVKPTGNVVRKTVVEWRTVR